MFGSVLNDDPKLLAEQLVEQTEQQTRGDGEEQDAPDSSEQKKHRRGRKPTGRAARRQGTAPDEVTPA